MNMTYDALLAQAVYMQSLAIPDAYYVDDRGGHQRRNGDEELGESHVNCEGEFLRTWL
jgi:hypothetical protein